MTPEEAAVINAAMAMTRIGHEPTVPEINVLRDATWKLITACNDCNHDTHTCPGCGAWVPHAGSGVCDNCAPLVDGASSTRVDGTEAHEPPRPEGGPTWQERQQQEQLQWVRRTWRDVRTGDKVRMPGTDAMAIIEMRYLHPSQDPQGKAWHVVSGGNGPFAHQKDHMVQPGECVVQLADEDYPRFMNPVAPVEIELTAEDVRVAELLGWENRR